MAVYSDWYPPTWLVTAPYRTPERDSIARTPWGAYHLKKDGALLTACGRYAVAWHVFWGHPVDPRDPDACHACLQRIRGHGLDPNDMP